MDESAAAPADTLAWARPPDFDQLNRYGWQWCVDESTDANYMDLAYLVARNATAKDGHMGCVLVSSVNTGSSASETQQGEVVLCTINSSLFGAHRSDCHAEANAVAECARRGRPVQGLSCYVTRAPCNACYKLLASAGIGRIVAPQPLDSADCVASAAALGIENVALRDSERREARRRGLGTSNEDMERVRALREERKRLRKEKNFGRKTLKVGGGAASGSAAPPGSAGASSSNSGMPPPEDEDGDIVDNDDSL
jgi:deoxycytidylate deaminase